jgi:Flp pilus assembly pilin Flp
VPAISGGSSNGNGGNWSKGGDRVKGVMIRFLENEEGQDIIEYALILAFICLAGAAMFLGMTGSQKVLWSAANNQLAAPNGIP